MKNYKAQFRIALAGLIFVSIIMVLMFCWNVSLYEQLMTEDSGQDYRYPWETAGLQMARDDYRRDVRRRWAASGRPFLDTGETEAIMAVRDGRMMIVDVPVYAFDD